MQFTPSRRNIITCTLIIIMAMAYLTITVKQTDHKFRNVQLVSNSSQHKNSLIANWATLETKQPIQVNRQRINRKNEESVIRNFLDKNTRHIMDASIPSFIPNLGSQCFWEKTYNFSDSLVRPGFTLRCLPSVYLIGFSKSGTSDLFTVLTRHQHVMGGFFKEAHFWSKNVGGQTLRDYTDQYSMGSSLIASCCLSGGQSNCTVDGRISPDMLRKLERRKQPVIGEKRDRVMSSVLKHVQNHAYQLMNHTYCPIINMDATPRYVWDGLNLGQDVANRGQKEPVLLTADKLYHVQPHAKIIIIMRRPENRLWSDYNFYPRNPKHTRTPDDFHEKVLQGIEWWRSCVRLYPLQTCAYGDTFRYIKRPSKGSAWDSVGASRVRISIYYIFIQRWLSVFPRESILFLRFEDYIKQPLNYLNDTVLPFLGLQPFSNYSIYSINERLHKGTVSLQNQSGNKTTMRSDTRDILARFYEPFNKKLAYLLNDKRFLWNDI